MAARTARKSAKTSNAGVPKAVLEKQKKLIPIRLAQVRGGRSQRSFARELGVFQQNVNRYESGTTPRRLPDHPGRARASRSTGS
jgi:DNA-binding transcriptional regulator YiaG